MPRLSPPRPGTRLLIKEHPLKFSYWPMSRGAARYGLQAEVYASNPWALIEGSVRARCSASKRAEAVATLAQGKFFFRAAVSADEWAAKPLLLYYSFMNLAKSYALTTTPTPTFDRARHGLSAKLLPPEREVLDAVLDAIPSSKKYGTSVFAEFFNAVAGVALPGQQRLLLPALLPQVIAGHRIWCGTTKQRERFIGVHDIKFFQDKSQKELWIILEVYGGLLSRHEIPRKQFLQQAQLKSSFREIARSPEETTDPEMLYFEQQITTPYSHRPSDTIPDLVAPFRHKLWATVNTAAPHRGYYVYLVPASEANQVVPQLVSMYAISYYLGSVARYRPQHFDRLLSGDFGSHIQELLTSMPHQFLYLLASGFVRRDVTRPGIV